MAGKKKKKNKDKGGAAGSAGGGKVKRKGIGLKGRFFLAVIVVAGLIFLPTSMLLLVGMLPSLVSVLFSSKGVGAKSSTVAAMNLAGCAPFVLDLWSSGNDFEASVDILFSSQTIMVMYLAAAFGYMIDWVVTGLVSSFLYQKGILRMKDIRKRQKFIIKRWGAGVAGDVDTGWTKKGK